MRFNRCISQCTKEGTHCEGCGRSHVEIAEIKAMVNKAADFASRMGYENYQDFAKSFAKSVRSTIEKKQKI